MPKTSPSKELADKAKFEDNKAEDQDLIVDFDSLLSSMDEIKQMLAEWIQADTTKECITEECSRQEGEPFRAGSSGGSAEHKVKSTFKDGQKHQRSASQESSRKPCRNCGGDHKKGQCPARDKYCFTCKKQGHMKDFCRSKVNHIVRSVRALDQAPLINGFRLGRVQSDYHKPIKSRGRTGLQARLSETRGMSLGGTGLLTRPPKSPDDPKSRRPSSVYRVTTGTPPGSGGHPHGSVRRTVQQPGRSRPKLQGEERRVRTRRKSSIEACEPHQQARVYRDKPPDTSKIHRTRSKHLTEGQHQSAFKGWKKNQNFKEVPPPYLAYL